MHRGASLIVWAIAEGRAAAAAIHAYLGGAGTLPAPVDARPPDRSPCADRPAGRELVGTPVPVQTSSRRAYQVAKTRA